MSTQPKGPRDIVEGGPERLPNGKDEPEETGKRGDAPNQNRESQREGEGKNAPHGGDVPPWYQPESGQPGTR